jgi:hypothetical protein
MAAEADSASQPAPPASRDVSPVRNLPDVGAPDAEAALREGLRSALVQVGVTNADEDAFRILRYAALLTPDDNWPQLSTTRLFVGVVGVGLALGRPRSYLTAFARATVREPPLKASYDKILELVRIERAEAALARLQPRWLSQNVTGILEAAVRYEGNAPFSEAIARTLLTYGKGLVYGRISMQNIESGMPRPEDDLLSQIDQTLLSLQISVTPRVRELLVHAAELRSTNEWLQPAHLYQALREAGRGVEGPIRSTDPSAMLYAAVSLDEKPGEGRTPPIA